MADATPPRVSSTPPHSLSEVSPDKATDVDRWIFGAKKFYAMTLNMPNLNSAGGSWVIRFAELNPNEAKGDLTAPEATQKVDPAYPLELMRRNVQGTVTLYAVIRNDGSVSDVRVLRGVDDQLDQYARTALAHWRLSARHQKRRGSGPGGRGDDSLQAGALQDWFLEASPAARVRAAVLYTCRLTAAGGAKGSHHDGVTEGSLTGLGAAAVEWCSEVPQYGQ